jgi:hypothetical protein
MAIDQEPGNLPSKTIRLAAWGLLPLATCLVLAGLILQRNGLVGAILVVLAAVFAGMTFLLLGFRCSYLWWMPPCAGLLFGVAFSLALWIWLPSTSFVFSCGLALGVLGLGLSLVVTNPHSPRLTLAVAGSLLFISVYLLLSGLGFSLRWISLGFASLSFAVTIAALYQPIISMYTVAGVLAVCSLLSALTSASSLRLLLPALLILGGLALLNTSTRQR